MSKLAHHVAIAAAALALPLAALADISGTPTLPSGQNFNFETGKAGPSGGDISWDGTNINFVGSATGVDAPFLSAVYGSITAGTISGFANGLSSSPITPAVNDVLIVKSNGKHYAKMQVSSVGASLVFKFTAFGVTPVGPNITGISNNYSNIPPGSPNYGIAPGTLFVVYGTGLASGTNTSETFPLSTSLGGTSISVTVGGKTVNASIYYIVSTQVAAVMPSNTPTGNGTLTLTAGANNTQVNVTIVDSAFGALSLYGTGTGQAATFHGTHQQDFVSYNSPATPGEYVVFWGSGVGADAANDDKTLPQHADNLTNIPMKAYVGGVEAQVYYRGRSAYPGVDQVIIIIPPAAAAASTNGHATSSGVQFGCNVAVWFLSGANSRASNFTTIPISANGEACSDANSIFGGVNISGLSGKSTVNLGFVEIFQSVSLAPSLPTLSVPHLRRQSLRPGAPRAATTSTNNDAFADFEQISGFELGNYASYQEASIGSCVVWQYTYDNTTTTPLPFTYTGLNAGTITVQNGSGATAQLKNLGSQVGFYDAQLADNFITTAGGTFTFTGTGGTTSISTGNVTIGPFSTSVSIGTPLFSSPNLFTATTVNRSQGYNATWSGGAHGTYVEIEGDSVGDGIIAGFLCLAHDEDLAFQVPGAVTSTLPNGIGSITLNNIGNPAALNASGLDFGYAVGGVLLENDNITWQ